MPRLAGLSLCLALLALGGCGGGDDKSSDESDTGSKPTTSKKAPLHGGTFRVNDVADCLIDSGVGAATSLEGADIDLNDAMSEVIVKQGAGHILVYGSASQAAAHEADYRKSAVGSSEVKQARNLLVQSSSRLAAADKAKLYACVGA